MRQRTTIRRITHNLMGGLAGKLSDQQLKQGLTDAELASRAGISIGFLTQIKTSATTPTPNTLAKLAKALKVKISDLVE